MGQIVGYKVARLWTNALTPQHPTQANYEFFQQDYGYDVCPNPTGGASFSDAMENLKYGTTPAACYTNSNSIMVSVHQTKAGISQMGVDMANAYLSSGIKRMQDLGMRPDDSPPSPPLPPPSPPPPPPSPATCNSSPPSSTFSLSLASTNTTADPIFGSLTTFCFKVHAAGCGGASAASPCCDMGLDSFQIQAGRANRDLDPSEKVCVCVCMRFTASSDAPRVSFSGYC